MMQDRRWRDRIGLGGLLGMLLLFGAVIALAPVDHPSIGSIVLGSLGPDGQIRIEGLTLRDESPEPPRPPAGIALWEDVIRKSPQKPRGYNNLAAIYAGQGRPALAADYYARGLALAANRPEWERREVQLVAGSSLGGLYFQLGRYEDAAVILTQTWNLNPGAPMTAVNLSYVALFYGQLARSDFAITGNPAGLTEMVRQAEQAITVLDAGIAAVESRSYRFENTHDLFWNRGEAYRLLGRCSEARASYAAALEINREAGVPPPCPIP